MGGADEGDDYDGDDGEEDVAEVVEEVVSGSFSFGRGGGGGEVFGFVGAGGGVFGSGWGCGRRLLGDGRGDISERMCDVTEWKRRR